MKLSNGSFMSLCHKYFKDMKVWLLEFFLKTIEKTIVFHFAFRFFSKWAFRFRKIRSFLKTIHSFLSFRKQITFIFENNNLKKTISNRFYFTIFYNLLFFPHFFLPVRLAGRLARSCPGSMWFHWRHEEWQYHSKYHLW